MAERIRSRLWTYALFGSIWAAGLLPPWKTRR